MNFFDRKPLLILVLLGLPAAACEQRQDQDLAISTSALQIPSGLKAPGPGRPDTCSNGGAASHQPAAVIPPAPVLAVGGPGASAKEPLAIKGTRALPAVDPSSVQARPLPAAHAAYLAELQARATELESLDGPAREELKAKIKVRHLGQ
jgi:hypothetical protein